MVFGGTCFPSMDSLLIKGKLTQRNMVIAMEIP
jgi:hypothetical protein